MTPLEEATPADLAKLRKAAVDYLTKAFTGDVDQRYASKVVEASLVGAAVSILLTLKE